MDSRKQVRGWSVSSPCPCSTVCARVADPLSPCCVMTLHLLAPLLSLLYLQIIRDWSRVWTDACSIEDGVSYFRRVLSDDCTCRGAWPGSQDMHKDDFIQHYRQYKGAMKESKSSVQNIVVDPSSSVSYCEFVNEGYMKSAIGALAGSGTPVRMHALCQFAWEGEQTIKEANLYLDVLDLLHQIGKSPALGGGIGLGLSHLGAGFSAVAAKAGQALGVGGSEQAGQPKQQPT